MINSTRRGTTKEMEGIKDLSPPVVKDSTYDPNSPEEIARAKRERANRPTWSGRDACGRPEYKHGRKILYCPHCQKSIPGYEAKR